MFQNGTANLHAEYTESVPDIFYRNITGTPTRDRTHNHPEVIMPSFHSSELTAMSEAEQKQALDSVYGAAMRKRQVLLKLRGFMQSSGSASTPEQTGSVDSLSDSQVEVVSGTKR